MNKAPVLTSDEVLEYFRKRSRRLPPFGTEEHREAQRDTDVAYYEPLIHQAKAETDAISYTQGVLDGEKKAAREIFEWGNEICEEHFIYNDKMYVMRKHCRKCWQSLKSKYMEVK